MQRHEGIAEAGGRFQASGVSDFDGPLIVDFDETLYLRNSTQDFLAGARPRMLSVALLRVLGKLGPWRWTGPRTADVWRTALICLLMPWVWLGWRRRAAALGAAFENKALAQALRGRARDVYIASFGFGPIVQPIVAGMSVPADRIITCRLFSFSDRRRGKLELLREKIGADVVAESAIITDSDDDDDILSVCSLPVKHVWPDAKYEAADSAICFPFEYSTKVKRPGKSYLRKIILHDFVIWIICALPYLLQNPTAILGVVSLFIAFWAVYEIGYIENDRMAETREADGVLSGTYSAGAVAALPRRLYLSAVIFSAIGLWFMKVGPAAVASWIGTLVALRAVYAGYNRIDKQSRITLYLILQLMRSCALLAVIRFDIVGVAFSLSYAIPQWMSYVLYRSGPVGVGYSWPKIPGGMYRLVLFVVMVVTLGISLGWTRESILGAAIGGFILAFQGRRDVAAAVKGAKLI
jgi:hypothetical protein